MFRAECENDAEHVLIALPTPCRDARNTVSPETVSSILQSLPAVIQRLQRRQTTFLTDALSAVHALSKRLLAVGAPCELGVAPANEQHASCSNLSGAPHQQSSRSAPAGRWDGSSTTAGGLEHFIQRIPHAACAWPEAQAQSAGEALGGFSLEVAAMTAPLPTSADASVLAALPPQEAAALLDRGSHCQTALHPAQTAALIAACISAKHQVAASERAYSRQQEHRSTQPCSQVKPAEATERDDAEGSTAQLGKAVMSHAALTSERCRAALPELLPHSNKESDLVHELPSCVAALLQAASDLQVQISVL